MGGNGLVRCPLCREVQHVDELLDHVKRHGRWEKFLWEWDHGSTRGRVALLFDLLVVTYLLALVIAVLRTIVG